MLTKRRRGYLIHEPIFDDQSIENSRHAPIIFRL